MIWLNYTIDADAKHLDTSKATVLTMLLNIYYIIVYWKVSAQNNQCYSVN